jgi:hypothetical protein
VLADLTECAFSGYAEVILSLTQFLSPSGIQMLVALDPATFTAGNPLTVPGQAVGYYLVNEGETDLICVEKFADVFPVDDIGDRIEVTVRLPFPGWGPVELE